MTQRRRLGLASLLLSRLLRVSQKSKIEMGELRFGSISEASWDGEQVHYRKLGCITAKVAANALAFYNGDISQLRNWDALTTEQQKEVRDVFAKFGNATAGEGTPEEKPKAEKKSKAAKKKKDDDDDVEDEAPKKKAKKAKKAKAPAVAMPGDDD